MVLSQNDAEGKVKDVDPDSSGSALFALLSTVLSLSSLISSALHKLPTSLPKQTWYRIDLKFLDRQGWAKSVDPDQTASAPEGTV